MDCYLKDRCKLYDSGKCRKNDYCQYKDRCDRLFDAAFIPENRRAFQHLYYDQDGTDKDKFEFVSKILNHITECVDGGYNFYIWSVRPGNGKTSIALQMCRAYIDKIWHTAEVGSCKVLFINVPQYFRELKSTIGGANSPYIEHIKENILKADLVVWDDIATKVATEFEMDSLFTAIDSRLYYGKANVFTSNTPKDCLKDVLGARIASRILGGVYEINLLGVDKRGYGPASGN